MARDLPSLNALRAFEAAARLGSVSQAAESLSVTHGAVSRQIKVLEEELGVALFLKEGRGLKLTDAGQRLRDVCGEAFERVRQVCAQLKREDADAPFVLGCSGSLLARWFIPRLGRLNAELPDLRLHLSAEEGDLDPRKPELDAVLIFAEPPWPSDLQVYELGVERIGPVMSPHFSGHDSLKEATEASVVGQPLLFTSSRPQAWPAWARRNGLNIDTLTFSRGFEHLYYLLEAAVSGLGIAIAPEPLVADDIRAGRLVAPWGFCETPGRLALWVPSRRVDARAGRLAAWLERTLRETSDQERLHSR